MTYDTVVYHEFGTTLMKLHRNNVRALVQCSFHRQEMGIQSPSAYSIQYDPLWVCYNFNVCDLY